MPFALPAIPLIGKALAALKAGGAAKAGMGAYKTLKPIVGKNVARFAGDRIHKIGRGFTKEGFLKNLGHPMNREELMMTVAPDLLFGGLAAATTEGDILDKAIAGAGSAVGGIGGGLGTRGLLGPKSNLGILGAEMVGGIAGDMVGMNTANALIRAKNGGTTPAEQRYITEQQQYKSALYDQFLAENGLG